MFCSVSYVDKPNARKPIDFNLLGIPPEFLTDQNKFACYWMQCLWEGFSDKILCIHVRLFKSVV